MPVKAAKRGDKYIVVEAKSGKKTPSSGRFSDKGDAEAQARAINRSLSKQGKI